MPPRPRTLMISYCRSFPAETLSIVMTEPLSSGGGGLAGAHHRGSAVQERFHFTCRRRISVLGGSFLNKKPLGSSDLAKSRSENAAASMLH